MKSARGHFILASLACLSLCFALVVALGGYFHSVERGGSSYGSEKHLISQLRVFHDRLRMAENPEDAKAALKVVESFGFGPESELTRELKKAYAPVLAVFAAKPREAEARFQYVKKRELMETLVNAYRKEVLHGDLRVRAAYLNILFDTQNSLLNESDEAEQVYLKRNRDRIDGLKGTVIGAKDAGLPVRVSGIDSIFLSYERGFQQALKWRLEKTEALSKEEKALPAIAKGVYAGEDTGVDDTRRTFLYICFVSVVIACASFLTLYLGFKVIRVRSEMKWEAFLSYLRAFGAERVDPKVQEALHTLREDSDWAAVVAEAQRAEENFVRSCQSLLAVPRSLRTPFLVVAKDRTIRHWNEGAAGLFGLTEGKEWGTSDIFQASRLGVKDGSIDSALELIRSSFASITEDRFELLILRAGEEPHPYELTMSPISSGPLAGGKILVWREIRSEAQRVDRAVGLQLERIRELVHKVTHQYAVDLTPAEHDAPASRAMIGDLALLKGRVEERELLWKSEAQALIDQVSRQQEILHRLSEELARIRHGQSEALELVQLAHGGEEHLHDEVCVLERDLERWTANRKRLMGDLHQQSAVLDKAKRFEEQLRIATAEVETTLETFDGDIDELRQFADAAKVHSVNLSLVRDPNYWEYASRARGFAHELARFTAKAEEIGRRIRTFVASHPGGALAAHLSGPGLDEGAMAGIAEEQERLQVLLQRWRESGTSILSGGEKAVALLQEAERSGAVVTQLGETSLLISQQARGNLERWS
ncbi:MAG: hypothetical protein ACXWR1_21115 [Bdellovibrionota bacterium]